MQRKWQRTLIVIPGLAPCLAAGRVGLCERASATARSAAGCHDGRTQGRCGRSQDRGCRPLRRWRTRPLFAKPGIGQDHGCGHRRLRRRSQSGNPRISQTGVAPRTTNPATTTVPPRCSGSRGYWQRVLFLQSDPGRARGVDPIDNEEDGPEGLINAWPMDESYIDYVEGNPTAGIINMPYEYPTIDADLITSLNEEGGEANVSTGWHAIEFLLWGQDLNAHGPGDLPVTDYTTADNADPLGRGGALVSLGLILRVKNGFRSNGTLGVTARWTGRRSAAARNGAKH